MDKSRYAMAKLGLDTKSSLAPKRDCSFYMKYFFLFASLIQFLIILGLVLFMIYGNAHSGTATHVQHLERRVQEQFARVTELSARNRNLTLQLNATAKQRQACLDSLAGLRAELTKCNASLLPCATIKVRPCPLALHLSPWPTPLSAHPQPLQLDPKPRAPPRAAAV